MSTVYFAENQRTNFVIVSDNISFLMIDCQFQDFTGFIKVKAVYKLPSEEKLLEFLSSYEIKNIKDFRLGKVYKLGNRK